MESTDFLRHIGNFVRLQPNYSAIPKPGSDNQLVQLPAEQGAYKKTDILPLANTYVTPCFT